LEFYVYERSADSGRPRPAGTLTPGPDHQDMYALRDLDRQRPLMDAIQQACATKVCRSMPSFPKPHLASMRST
jgi:hypothetical protein